MASLTTYPFHGCYKTPGVAIVAGSFEVSSGSVVATTRRGNGWSVVKSDVGKYTVTFDEKFPMPIAAGAQVNDTGDDQDFNAHTGALAVPMNSLIIYTLSGANDADLTAVVSFWVLVSWTTINRAH